jgi:hypothetical protein
MLAFAIDGKRLNGWHDLKGMTILVHETPSMLPVAEAERP